MEMDNLTQNGTFDACSTSADIIHMALNIILLFFSFPATFVVIVKLLSKIYKTRSFSTAEVFLLQINLANVFLFVFNLLLFLDIMYVSPYSDILYMVFFSPTITARPVFLVGICGTFYVAIVHPVAYMTYKTRRHWEWVVVTFGWLYALAMNVAIVVHRINIFAAAFTVMFYNTILPSMFFNIATLRALSSSGPGNTGQTLNPAKKKAYRIILSILVFLLLYYVPRMYYIIYPYVAPMDLPRFLCYEGAIIMFLPKCTEVAMPVIFLYSLRKLGV